MASGWISLDRTWARLRREPVVHFFLLGAVLFAVQHWLVSEGRTIVVTPGLKAELARRFEDLRGRPPSPPELETELRQWERDEALFREAMRRGLERDDPTVRGALIAKMRAIALAEVHERAPSDAELQAWLAAHRETYEAPTRYDFDFFEFPKAENDALVQLENVERALREGRSPTSLGRPLLGANLTVADMKGRILPELAARLPSLPAGQWTRVEAERALLLARVKRVDGGLPSFEVLRPRLQADWALATQQELVDHILDQAIERYHVEPGP